MKKIFTLLCLVPFISFGQEVFTGLKFTPESQLRGIPLASMPYAGDHLPSSVDLSPNMPPAGNQGHQQSCVAWSVAYACKSFAEKLEENNDYYSGNAVNYDAVFSPAYIYNQINNRADGGSSIVDALNILSQKGAVKWSVMPYNERDYLTLPAPGQDALAARYKIDFWRRVNYVDGKEVKAQLNANYPVIIGAWIDEGFREEGYGPNRTNFVWDGNRGRVLGGHAMLVVGYDDNRQAFKLINSWGTEWGNNGYCWVSYAHFADVVKEAFVFKDATNEPVNSPVPTPTPVADPTDDLSVNLQLNEPIHNFPDNFLGPVIRFTGAITLPQNLGNQMQIVIRFYYNNNGRKGALVGSLSPRFSMPDGSAACGTPQINVSSGLSTTWYASMPYSAFNIPRGGFPNLRTTYLIAEPVLYLDNFAVQHGQLFPFFVRL